MKRTTMLMILSFLFLAGSIKQIHAQQYTGMSGLIHVPSADIDKAGEIRIGAHFLNKNFTPDRGFNYGGKYTTLSHYSEYNPFLVDGNRIYLYPTKG